MHTDLEFIKIGAPWPPLDKDTKERMAMYEANKKLFEGDHAPVFKEAWKRVLREDQQKTIEFVLNWFKRLSTLWADLLVGEPFKVDAGSAQATIDDIIQANSLHLTAYKQTIDLSRYADAPLKIYTDGVSKNAKIVVQQPRYWHPVVDPLNVQEFIAHVIAVPVSVNGKPALSLEIHEKGKITRRQHWLVNGVQVRNEYGEMITSATIGQLVKDEEVTPHVIADDFLIIPASQMVTSDRCTGIDDYTDLCSINQEAEVRLGQIARILDKHSDPGISGPTGALEVTEQGEWVLPGGGKFWPREPGEDVPQYITWDGQLTNAFTELEKLKEEFYFISETCAAAFGEVKTGQESGVSIKRLMMAPLAKVNRMRLYADPAIKKALTIAAALQNVKIEDLKIEWQDGLPLDEKEQADIDSTLYTAGLMSLETSLRRRGFEGERLDEEIKRIKEEQDAKQPKVDPNKGPDITAALEAAKKTPPVPPAA